MSQANPKETPCPDCGEMVRINSLRCWNCGGFMNRDVEEKYIAMQASPRPVIFSEGALSNVSESPEQTEADDFQLKTPIARQMAAETPKSGSTSDDVIRIRAEEPTAAAPETKPTPDVAGSFLDEEPAETPAASPSDAAKAEEKPQRPREQAESDVAHSVATGGDALLDIAIKEEQEVRKRLKHRKVQGGIRTPGGGLIIYCPYGCKVEVKESHRGMTGRCPRCQAPFIVPVDPPQFKTPKAEAAATGEAASTPAADLFRNWIPDLHLHVVDPAKLKLKADSLFKDFIEVDVGFSNDVMLVASLAKKAAGRFGKAGGKKEEIRSALQAYLAEKKPLEEAPTGDKYAFESEELSQVKVVQPATDRASNLFHGIPVFGTNRVAVQLPFTDKTPHPLYLSMGITEFWKFRKALEEVYQISGLDDEAGLPREPRTHQLKCHFLETPIKALLDVELYKADPTVKLEVAGYECGACKTAVSEAGRKKENLGGKSPKGIAKAKCPKCSTKMGEHLLYSLATDVAEPSLA